MSRRESLLSSTAPAALLVAVVALLAAPDSRAFFWVPVPSKASKQPAAHSKRRAERNVLMLVPRAWNARARRLGLINVRSNLLKDNVSAVCRGLGRRIGTRYNRFRCVVRPWPRRGAAGLYLMYRAGEGERFRLHLVRVRRP